MTKLFCSWKNNIFYIKHYVKDIRNNNIGQIININKTNVSVALIVIFDDKKTKFVDTALEYLETV